MVENNYILEMEGIVKKFPGVKALDGVNLKIKQGEVHALLGENGAGKSTLMNVLLGIITKDEGTIRFLDQEVSFKNPHAALEAGISMIHQEISLIPSMDVAENIWVGRERLFTNMGLIGYKKRQKETQKILERLSIKISPTAIVQSLSVAQQQLVELVKAISYNPKLIIMDEPTSSLSEGEIILLFKVIKELTEQGTAVIFISHKLDEVYKICHHATILRDGRYIADSPISDLREDALMKYIAGREVNNLFPKIEAEITDTVLEVRNLTTAGFFKDISFSLRKGEILGFSGLVGAGRTEVMQAIFGIDKFDSGEVFIHGQPVKIRSPKHAMKYGLGMVTEDRLQTGIIPSLSVKMNTSLAYLQKITKKGFINFKQETKDTQNVSVTLNVKTASMNQLIASLSGGNQQKAIVGKWLLNQPDILILDEPTRGIDVGSKSEIHKLISELAAQGMAVIMISSELPEIMGMSDRIFVMREGRIAGEFERNKATPEELIKCAFAS